MNEHFTIMAFNKEDWKTPATYGGAGWIYLLLQFLALLFFCFAAFTCWLTVSESTDLRILVGYWSRESVAHAEAAAISGRNRNYCVSWDSTTKEDLFDGPWHFGRAVGVIGGMIIIPSFLISLCLIVIHLNRTYFVALACTHVFMVILSILLLSGLGSDICEVESCRLGPGGYLAILDTFLWMATSYAAYVLALRNHGAEATRRDTTREERRKPVVETRKPIVVTMGTDPSVSETEKEEEAGPKSPPRQKKQSVPTSPSNKKIKKKKKTDKKKREEEP